LAKAAHATVFGLTHATAFATIKRISYAVGLPALMDTFDAVRAETTTNAVDLIDTSLRLDQSTAFPERQVEQLARELEGQPFALAVLRALVVNHFNLFPVHFKTKQAVCEALGIPYKKLQASNPRSRLIGGTHPADQKRDN
jgi:hypothetical protein